VISHLWERGKRRESLWRVKESAGFREEKKETPTPKKKKREGEKKKTFGVVRGLFFPRERGEAPSRKTVLAQSPLWEKGEGLFPCPK